MEGDSVLKNVLGARFGPKSGPKYTVFGGFWSLWSPIRSHREISADFFNRQITHVDKDPRTGAATGYILRMEEGGNEVRFESEEIHIIEAWD